MDQITVSEAEYQDKKRETRRELFLERMDTLTPWTQLEKQGLMLREGSIVDATISSAPSSTKNKKGENSV